MPVLQWGMLCVLSLLLSIGFLAVHLPAALLLGPMLAGIIFSMRGVTLQLPRSAFLAAQAILGCMIAQNLTGSILTTLAVNWLIVLTILLVTLLSSAIVGWLLVRYSSLPGNTGAWGSSPGGAAAMVAMAQDYGADIRLVAFMQYLRVLFVAGTAGCLLRLPSGTMLIPMLAGAVLQSGEFITIELPEWLLAIAYMAIGWRIGLGFDKQILLRALRPLPQILLSIFALLAICAGMAWGLTWFMHIDFMTAYLATSPGGLDTVAVIAAGSNADMALIMAMQTLRLFSILLTGPAIARFISTYAPKRSA
ncbi:AbrB family transcriptional regulator [Escherichia marmotae]|nr:AbrB family transcriptional regulator [Escherichia marmotae]